MKKRRRPEEYATCPPEELAAEVAGTLRRSLMHGKSIGPAVMVYMTNGKSSVLPLPWHDARWKRASINALRDFMRVMDVHRYCFFSEGWISTVDTKGEPLDMSKPLDVMPRDDPQRREVVFVIVADKGAAEPVGQMLEIKRTATGKVRSVTLLEGTEGHMGGNGGFAGEMATMLATFQ